VRFIEVSHRVVPGMKTYPGLPEPTVDVIVDYESSRERYGGKAEFLIASLHLCGNTGTYVDSPHHRFADGVDLAGLALERIAHVPVVIVDATRAGRAIGPELFRGSGLAGHAVLVRTDFSRHWGTDAYFNEHPYLTAASAELLVSEGASFVGIDSLNIDDTADLSRPAHTKLLGAGIPICEHMTNLATVPSAGLLHAVPIAWVGGATFPVRAYVIAEDARAGG
jgi:arylformamidase